MEANRNKIESCKTFIRENFLQMPTPKSVAMYSLFINKHGTFTNVNVIKQALKEVKPNELYKR